MSRSEILPGIRCLGPEDALAFSGLRQAVTRDNPVPMGLSIEDELSRTLDSFRAQLAAPLPNAVFGAFVGDELVATAAVSRSGPFGATRHKFVMWGVFTAPHHRRRGLSRWVVLAALTHAFDSGAHRVNLQVYVPNEAAVAMYRTLGFTEYGIEPDAICLDGRYHAGVLMTRQR